MKKMIWTTEDGAEHDLYDDRQTKGAAHRQQRGDKGHEQDEEQGAAIPAAPHVRRRRHAVGRPAGAHEQQPRRWLTSHSPAMK